MNYNTLATQARLNPEHILHNMFMAIDARSAAEQKERDELCALRMRSWGNIEKLTWAYNWETDDQGGTYRSLSDFEITIAGHTYSLGYSLTDEWSDLVEKLYELSEVNPAVDGPLEPEEQLLFDAYRKMQLATALPESNPTLLEHTLADLAGMVLEEFQLFLWVADKLVEADQEVCVIKFGPGT